MLMNNLSYEQLPPLSLYVHIPWCVRKCPYCDFNSHNQKGNLPEDEYITSLIQDAESALPLIWGRSIQTIFIGGGTPSLFSGAAINRLLTELRMRFKISPYAEITLEANPGTVEQNYISEYAHSGVNRISLGVQSFNSQHLQTLGRIHSPQETYLAIDKIKQNFINFNLDIIYGLPNQTIAEAQADILQAIDCQPTHLSAYNLTIEPNTQFAKRVPQGLPDDDICYQMQDSIIDILQQHNYQRYETSAYAKPHHQSQHNRNYWQFGDYLGIGAGAHSKLSFHDRIIRQMRYKHPAEYMQKVKENVHIQTDQQIALEEISLEFMMNALRLTDGFANQLFSATTGLPFGTILPQLLIAQEQGYLQLTADKIIPTKRGQDFLNNLLEVFM